MKALYETSGKYDVIWKKIKKSGECSVKCNPGAKKTIIQGVKKAKYQDMEFKFANEGETLYLDIFCTLIDKDNEQITFRLRQFPGIEPLVRT